MSGSSGGDGGDVSAVIALVDRYPQVSATELLDGLVPPPLFDEVSFDTYRPDPAEPTQAAAVAAMAAFAGRLRPSEPRPRWWRRAPAPPEGRLGIYLDGGFGVGKTHLLASLWHAAPDAKAFATFVELTNLVGALGFSDAVDRLASYRLVCIDEFELDDPGDTVLVSTLLSHLVDAGVALAATSNTLPDRLGEGRFAATDFLREIHGLAAHFDVVRIDGPDYRHRGVPRPPVPATEEQLERALRTAAAPASDDFDALLDHLASVHPSRYGVLVADVDLLALRGVRPVDDQSVALRLVALVDRLYDRGVRLVASGVPLDQVFPVDLLRGGYRKKYLRALSRLVAMAEPEPAPDLR